MSSDVWGARAEAYRSSATHAGDPDLDTVVELCEPRPGLKVLDVATGGGHVARRLREAGAEVVTADASPGMGPDVVCPAEHLPFADGSFDVVVTRIAPHHFGAIREAVAEMARVSSDLVVVEDTLYTSPEVEEAEAIRDPTHVRNYSEDEWRGFLEDAGLVVERVDRFRKTHVLDDWLARTGCTGDDEARVRELLADVTSADGATWQDTKLIVKSRKAESEKVGV
ncbi:MAG TPA: methyltransferase domain-containing protein [Gaiellaceae bacterium]|nr:methyltransferase domain-containing protein [Gaiellaceae bacterium]